VFLLPLGASFKTILLLFIFLCVIPGSRKRVSLGFGCYFDMQFTAFYFIFFKCVNPGSRKGVSLVSGYHP